MTDLEALKAARELLSDKTKWTQRAMARDAEGKEAEPSHPDAVCFCALGAAERCGYYGPRLYDAALALDLDGVATTNDDNKLGYDAVLALYDKAIEIEEQDQ